MIIKIKTIPNSSKEEIEEISKNEYKIYLKEPAECNKANMRLINILAKKFGISHKYIKIKNPASKNKIVEISNLY